MGFQKEIIPAFERYQSEVSFDQIKPQIYSVRHNSEVLVPSQYLVLVLTGPTGAGKDTIRDMLPSDVFTPFKTCTTRPRRQIEAEGDDDPYHRLSVEEFEVGMGSGDFFEVNQYNGHYYGGRVADVEQIMERHLVPVFRIDPNGADNYQELFKAKRPPFHNCSMITLFVTPPEFQILADRLYNRDVKPYLGGDNDQSLWDKYQERVEIAKGELERLVRAHFVAINTDGSQQSIVRGVTELVLEYLK